MAAAPAPNRDDLDVESFRARLRAWIGEHLQGREAETGTEGARRLNSQRMYDAGLLGLTWPVEVGGRGLGADHQTVWNEEMRDYEWALPYSAVTAGICAPVLRDFGTDAQRKHHLPRMLRGDERWTQLLSEPGAGSDLANVSTSAKAVDDGFVLQGQKVWTSAALDSDLALALVRTSREERRHHGLTMVIVDLTAPGVDIRPLREMNGDSQFNEVFLDGVQVPRESVVGETGSGWSVLMAMLGYERLALGAATAGNRMDADAFTRLVRLTRRQGTVNAPHIAHALLDVYVEQRILDLNGVRIRRAMEKSGPHGPLGSIAKVGTASAAEAAARAAVLAVGPPAIAWADDDEEAKEAAHDLLSFPYTSIAGGTTEIQKNSIAERLLGLPRS